MMPIIVGATHHKTGTVLLNSIMEAIIPPSYPRVDGQNKKYLSRPPEMAYFKFMHCRFGDFKRLYKDFKGVHIIRHPYEVIVSGYNYHKICREDWAISPNYYSKETKTQYNKSYQEILNSLSLEEGLMFEAETVGADTILSMLSFDYTDKRFLNLKLEDFYESYDRTISQIANFLSLHPLRCIAACASFDKRRKTVISPHITNTTDLKFKFPQVLNQDLKEFINSTISKLGYKDFLKELDYEE